MHGPVEAHRGIEAQARHARHRDRLLRPHAHVGVRAQPRVEVRRRRREAALQPLHAGVVDLRDVREDECAGRRPLGLEAVAEVLGGRAHEEVEVVRARGVYGLPVRSGGHERERRDERLRLEAHALFEGAAEQLAALGRRPRRRYGSVVGRLGAQPAGGQNDDDRGGRRDGRAEEHHPRRRQPRPRDAPLLLAGGGGHELGAQLGDEVAHRRTPMRSRSAPSPRLTRLRTTASDVPAATAISS